MRRLELLAPAKDKVIGIAAIDCGADAVYIAGPEFGARKAAGNQVEDIAALCGYAHRFGARVFVTFNTIIEEGELERAHSQMLECQKAGADAFIIRDARIASWKDITVPLHASTQCSIRDSKRALEYQALGCSRIILERELSLEQVREICSSVDCEVEFFVHGALCVCYSGECLLSERLDGRSADKGECIQACRSLYTLEDEKGKVILKDKAVLSLKDYRLLERLADLAQAGVCSFKIEGRLKNETYVRNVVREYSQALDALVGQSEGKYGRASFGTVRADFTPDSGKTFNRGYTSLFLDGRRSRGWSSMDAPKSMGELMGQVAQVKHKGRTMEVRLTLRDSVRPAGNGDGFAFVHKTGIIGFRADKCENGVIIAKDIAQLSAGMALYRNIDTEFEKKVLSGRCRREIPCRVDVRISGDFNIELKALTQDGREIVSSFGADTPRCENPARALEMMREQLSKRASIYNFSVGDITVGTRSGALPLLSAATLNSMRRLLAEDLDRVECKKAELLNTPRPENLSALTPVVQDKRDASSRTLMKSKYCVKYELGLCPIHQKGIAGRLYITNNSRRFALEFDCKECEMRVVDLS